MTRLNTSAKENLRSYAKRRGYDPAATVEAWRRGLIAPTHHVRDGKLVVEPVGGFKLHELKAANRFTADRDDGRAYGEHEQPSLLARRNPDKHEHRLRVAEARREHEQADRRRSTHANARRETGGYTPPSLRAQLARKRGRSRGQG